MKRRLLIDDMRTDLNIIDGNKYIPYLTMIARNYNAGIMALEKCGPWAELYLDHDLGILTPEREKTGYDVMCWLEEHKEYLPEKIICVSSNPPGRDRIELVIRKLYGEI